MIRGLGCAFPVEIMYFDDVDLGPDLRDELEWLPRVLTRNLKLSMDDNGLEIKTSAGKPRAALESASSEVVLVNADAIYFQNPEVLYQDIDFVRYGALFFHLWILNVEDLRLPFIQSVIFRDQNSFARHRRQWVEYAFSPPIGEKVTQSRM